VDKKYLWLLGGIVVGMFVVPKLRSALGK